MEYTGIDSSLDSTGIGYVMNSPASPELRRAVENFQYELHERFGEDVYLPKDGALHITLLDWFTTNTTYTEDVDTLFSKIRDVVDEKTRSILNSTPTFHILFDKVELFPPCIILKATQQEAFPDIRKGIISQVELTPGTKVPPPIVHCTIAAFRKHLPLSQVQEAMKLLTLPIEEKITSFRLVRETKNRHQAYEVLDTYPLATGEPSSFAEV